MQVKIQQPRIDEDGEPGFLHISWLYAQDYCEYQLYLEHVKGISVNPTSAMVTGSAEHLRLEEEFLAEAKLDLTFVEAVEASRKAPVSTRELYVEDRDLTICGI